MATTQDTLADDEQDPWKNKDTLEGLYHDDDLNQTEIAEHFSQQGHSVTPPTISYWMNKLEIDTTHTSHGNESIEDNSTECKYHDTCGNEAVGTLRICDTCLDLIRKRDSSAVYSDYPAFLQAEYDSAEDLNDYMAQLHNQSGTPLTLE